MSLSKCASANRTPCPRPRACGKPAFITSLRQTGNVSGSARAAKVVRSTAHEAKHADEAFASEWADALEEAADRLEAEAFRRAHDGVDKPIFHQGRKCGVVREYSDGLLMFLLKAAQPNKYAERSKQEHTGGVKIVRLPAKEVEAP